MPTRPVPSRAAMPLVASPYGLSFKVEDLMIVQGWALRSGLLLRIRLDQTLEGREFEELLIISGFDRRRRMLTLWNVGSGFMAQVPHGRPRPYASVAEALNTLEPRAPRRAPWRLF